MGLAFDEVDLKGGSDHLRAPPRRTPTPCANRAHHANKYGCCARHLSSRWMEDGSLRRHVLHKTDMLSFLSLNDSNLRLRKAQNAAQRVFKQVICRGHRNPDMTCRSLAKALAGHHGDMLCI